MHADPTQPPEQVGPRYARRGERILHDPVRKLLPFTIVYWGADMSGAGAMHEWLHIDVDVVRPYYR